MTNVLLGQGYRAPRGAVINEYGAGGIMISRGKLKISRTKPPTLSLYPPLIENYIFINLHSEKKRQSRNFV
jgi:hypothetical protein